MIGIIPRSFGVHDGSFHADEVTAAAILLYFDLIDREEIVRTRDYDKLAHLQFVCDVGGVYDPSKKRFDHHQATYKGLLSSAGMVWQYLKDEKIIEEGLYEFMRERFIHGVDEVDTGVLFPPFGHADFSSVISSFIPISYDATNEEMDKAFFVAVDFAYAYLGRMLQKYHYLEKCKARVLEVMQAMDECLIFEEKMPWLEPFFALGGDRHSAEFVIMPSGDHWKLRGVPPTYEKRMEVRKPLPEEWAGKINKDLQDVTGIKEAIFCHKGRFISVWETKEAALKALKHVLERK
ncbi:MYG1 family protein [bacterium]|nr:MYG1 family protein [bacterium]